MNKKKIFTYLFIGLLAAGATGTVTSCKDYDDDINNLQDQIDKAALKSDVEALKTQLSSVESTANAAQTKAEKNATDILAKADKSYVDGVKTTAETAAETAAKAVTAAANAQATADEAKTLAQSAKDLATTAGDAATKNAKAIEAINTTLNDLKSKIGTSVATPEDITKAVDAAKEEIAKNYASKADLTKLQETLKSIYALKSEAATAQALKDSCAALENKITAAATQAQFTALKTTVDGFKASIDQLFSALTGVELFATYTGQGLNVSDLTAKELTMMHGLVPEDSKFGDNESGLNLNSDPIITFVKGADIKADGGVIVKVNPVNVDITKATIKLINSKGEVLDEVVAGTPVKYDALITRASANVGSGLWKIPFTVKDGTTAEAFEKATKTTVNGAEKDILYAVAICNTDKADDRYVSSTYDLGANYEAYTPASILDYSVNGTDVADIHNRWTGTETKTEDAVKEDANIGELTWKTSSDQYPTPATAIAKDNKNVVSAGTTDARYVKSPLHVEVGQAFDIKLKAEENQPNKAQYYYVTLDEKRAIESTPSELNAWKGYSYDGLLKTVSADSVLSLKVNSAAANGDIIGFRVFAVNYDGTLQDPDGRAFYVQVGDAANAEAVKGDINVTSASAGITAASSLASADGKVTPKANYVDIKLTKSFQASTSNVSGELGLDNATKGNVLNGEKVYYTLLDKDKKAASNWKDAKYVRVAVNNAGNWKDGTSLSGTVTATKDGSSTSAAVTLNSLTITVTKVLPTAANYKLTFLPKQEDTEGSGNFTMYLVPKSGWAATTTSKVGTGDFDNIFYNLPDDITFSIASAKKNDDKKDVANVVDNTTGYEFSEAVGYIDSETYHALTAAVNFGKISTETKAADGSEADYKLTIDQALKVRFACWETANTYAWGTEDVLDKDGNKIGTKSLKPSIMWDAAGNYKTIEIGTAVNVVNSYDPVRFDGNFSNLIGGNQYLTIVDGSAHFTYGSQEDPYFKPTIATNGNVTLTNTQTENAPTADHEENLVFKVKDAYGHTKTISLAVTVKRPTK